jgi:hypothetical protein
MHRKPKDDPSRFLSSNPNFNSHPESMYEHHHQVDLSHGYPPMLSGFPPYDPSKKPPDYPHGLPAMQGNFPMKRKYEGGHDDNPSKRVASGDAMGLNFLTHPKP